MAYCQKCGKEKEYPNGRCNECGFMPPLPAQRSTQPDDGGFLWGLLGFCIPVVGLILYLIWKDERPNTALAAGKGALAYCIFSIVLVVLYVIVFAGLMGISSF